MKASISEIMRGLEKALVYMEEKSFRETMHVAQSAFSIDARRVMVGELGKGKKTIKIEIEVEE